MTIPATVRHGAYPVLFTPFKEDGAIDYPALDEMADFYADKGVGGLFAVCLSGEIFNLTPEERLEISRRLVRRVGNRVTIVSGGNVSGDLEKQARDLSVMHETGAPVAVVIVSVLPEPTGLDAQLLRLAELTDGPLGLYECPVPEHRLLTAEEVRRVAASGRFVFMKETSPSPEIVVGKTRATLGTALNMFPARLKSTPEALGVGAVGHCGVIANVAPELTATMCDASLPDEARRRAFEALVELHDVMAAHHYPISGKYILQRRGLNLGLTCRDFDANIFTQNDRNAINAFLEGFRFDVAEPGRLAQLGMKPGPSTWKD